MKKRYYHDHEGAYLKIREKGEFGWQTPSWEDFQQAKEQELLSSIIRKHFPDSKGKRALDLGCGSGPTAHTLHDLGFETTGIDVSQTAIDLANEIALKEKKQIHFEVADVLNYEGKFDFIYDSHCFHCIVPDEDRKAFLSMLKRNLSPNGIAFINTMICINGYDPGIPGLRFDENFVLWHPTKDPSRDGCALHEGQWWCPQRRILPRQKIIDEINCSGLKISRLEIESQVYPDPDMLQVLVSL
jgi:SAM-dependent methyltransferase